GVAEVEIVPRDDDPDAVAPETLTFSEHLACTHCGLSFDELAPRNFSFNSPYGACERCDGLGTRFEVDPELVVPNDDLSIREGAIAPWSGFRSQYFERVIEAVADDGGFSIDTPWRRLRKADKKAVLYGTGKAQVRVSYRNRYGRQRSYTTSFERVEKEVNERLRFLLDVGLDYLSLNRSSATLAGGEAQRIRLASQIGSGLVGVLYVLDEPSIGLHQRDNQRLVDTLLRLRDLGNTV